MKYYCYLNVLNLLFIIINNIYFNFCKKKKNFTHVTNNNAIKNDLNANKLTNKSNILIPNALYYNCFGKSLLQTFIRKHRSEKKRIYMDQKLKKYEEIVIQKKKRN
jgi:hypothetical protein